MTDKPISVLEQRRQELDKARAEYQYSVEKLHEDKQRANNLRTEYEEYETYYNNRVMRRDNINAQLRETRRDIANLEKSLKDAKTKLTELEAKAKTVIRPEATQAGKAFEVVRGNYRWGLLQIENSKKAVHLATEKPNLQRLPIVLLAENCHVKKCLLKVILGNLALSIL